MSIDMNSVNSAIAERTLRTSGLKEATSPQPVQPSRAKQKTSIQLISNVSFTKPLTVSMK